MTGFRRFSTWSLRLTALPMAHTPHVEWRLKAILQRNRRREMLTRRTWAVAALATVGGTALLAALRPVARAEARAAAPAKTAASDPKALRLLTQMVAAYKALTSYSGDEVAVGDPGLAMPYELSLTFQRPGRMVADITHHYGGKEQRSHVLLDGKALYLSSAGAPSRVSRVTTARTNYTLWDDAFIAREEVKMPLVMDLLEQSDGVAKALTQEHPDTAVSMGAPSVVDGVPVDTIIERTTRGGSVSTGVLQIGQSDHLLRRVTEDSRATYQNPSHVSQTFLHVRANPTLPNATFVFTAPPGVVVTDEHPAGADADPAAITLLTRMYAAYAALQSFSCTMDSTLTSPDAGSGKITTIPIEHATYAVEKPYRIAAIRTGSPGITRAVSDGAALYVTTTEPNGQDSRYRRMDALSGRYLRLPLLADSANIAVQPIELRRPGDLWEYADVHAAGDLRLGRHAGGRLRLEDGQAQCVGR